MLTSKHAKQFFFSAFTLIVCATPSFADDSAAVYFAKQSGVIAGAAEACGQPISLMVMRSGEVIDALSTDQMDKTYATAAFERSRQQSHDNLIQSQQITCPKVITDFNNLPLLQPDYKTTVLQPLIAANPAAAAKAAAATTTPPAATTPAIATPAPGTTTAPTAGATATNPAAPGTTAAAPSSTATNNLLPTTPPATQSYVTGAPTAPAANPAAMPPINPGYNPNASNNPPPSNSEAARLQLAQQLAQMAQTLVTNGQQTTIIGAGQPSQYNPAYNPQLNEQLYGMGANNPIFTGNPLPPINAQQPPAQQQPMPNK